MYFCVDTYIDTLVKDIECAQHSIEFESYIFELGSIAERLLGAFTAAAARGVRVRLVLDGFGARGLARQQLSELTRARISTRIYHPLPRPFSLFFQGTWPNIRRSLSLLGTWNRRTHRKMCVIDRQIAYVGSANITDRHRHWRETTARISGPDVAQITRSFSYVWSRSLSPVLPRLRREYPLKSPSQVLSQAVRTNYTLRLQLRHRLGLQRMLLRARQRVWIQTAYFVPSPMLLRALMHARDNGANVLLMVPYRIDIPLMRWVAQLSQLTLLRSGVKIYEYMPTMLHAKTILLDDRAIVGSTNLNYRSFYHDLEADVVLTHQTSLEDMAEQFKQDLANARAVSEADLISRPWINKAAGYFALILRNWL